MQGNIPSPVVFELVNQAPYHCALVVIIGCHGMTHFCSSPENLFQGIISIQMKAGTRQAVLTTEAEYIFSRSEPFPAVITNVRIEKMYQGNKQVPDHGHNNG